MYPDISSDTGSMTVGALTGKRGGRCQLGIGGHVPPVHAHLCEPQFGVAEAACTTRRALGPTTACLQHSNLFKIMSSSTSGRATDPTSI